MRSSVVSLTKLLCVEFHHSKHTLTCFSDYRHYTFFMLITLPPHSHNMATWRNDHVTDISSPLVKSVSCIVAVLSNLSALYIQRRFDYDYVDISDVTMETVAVASSNDVEVSYVENCTCGVSSRTAGTRIRWRH